MNPRQIFIDAPLGESQDAITEYLDQACGGDSDLRREVEALIAADEAAGDGFLECPPVPRGIPGSSDGSDSGIPPERFIDGYKLLEKIGEGGFGEVYMAEQLEPVRRRVAFKLIKPGMDSRQVVARFEAERQALAMMEHPSIAKVLGAGTTPAGRPYFVMELVKGIPITEFCDRKRLDTEARLRLFVDVCHAVQHAHQKGIIHRDLKPSNVMVTMHGDRAVPKVIDFGVAKATQADLTDKTLFTRYEQFIGTPAYMSPEQAQMSGLDIDTRSDIYGLGVLLYELLTGRPPFDVNELARAGQDEVRRKICQDEPPRPSTKIASLTAAERTDLADHLGSEPRKLRTLLSNDLDWVVMKALEKDRARRYETATGLAADVERALADQPVEAGPPGLAYRASKLVRRHRLPLAAAASIALILIAATVVSISQRSTAISARNQAEESSASLARTATELENQLVANQATNRALERQVEQTRTAQSAAENSEQIVSFQLAEELLNSGNDRLGIAQLAMLIRRNAGQALGSVAAQRLASSLEFKQFPMPAAAPVFGGGYSAVLATMSPDGSRSAMLWGHGTLSIRSSGDGTVRDIVTIDPSLSPTTISFAPDSTRLVVSGLHLLPDGKSDGWAMVYDSLTGETIGEKMPHGRLVGLACFSPDNRYLLTGDDEGMVRLWEFDPAAASWQVAFSTQLPKAVVCGEFTADSRAFVTGCYDGTAQVWDLAGDQLTSTVKFDHGDRNALVRAISISGDGERVATGCSDGSVAVWDRRTGREIAAMRHDHMVTDVDLDRTGAILVSASFDRTARLWNATTGQALAEPFRHGGSVMVCRFYRDGSRVLTASRDGTARLWDVASGRPVGPVYRRGSNLSAAEISPDGQQLLTAGSGAASWWQIPAPRPLSQLIRHPFLREYTQKGGAVSGMFSPDGKFVVSASISATTKITDAATGALLQWPRRGASARISNDSRFVATAWVHYGGSENGIEIGELDPEAPVWRVSESEGTPGPFAFDAATRLLAASFNTDGEHQISVFDLVSRKETVIDRGGRKIFGLEFCPRKDQPRLLVNYGDGDAVILDAGSAERLVELPGNGPKRDSHSEFGPLGDLVLTRRDDNTVVVREAETGKVVVEVVANSGRIHGVSMSPDRTRIATASADHTARLWDATTGQPMGLPMRHGGPVRGVEFSPDGAQVVTCSKDGTARLWDAWLGLPRSEPLRHDRWVQSVDFNHDGSQLLSSDVGATVRVWNVPPATDDIPDWFPGWAEAVAGLKINTDGSASELTWEETQEGFDRARRLASNQNNSYHRLVAWFHDDPATRTISPHGSITRERFVANRIGEGFEEGLLEAIHIDPDNGLALAALTEMNAEIHSGGDPQRSLWAEYFGVRAKEAIRTQLAEDPGDIASWRAFVTITHDQEDLVVAVKAYSDMLASGGGTVVPEGFRDGLTDLLQRAIIQQCWTAAADTARLMAATAPNPFERTLDEMNVTAVLISADDTVALAAHRASLMQRNAEGTKTVFPDRIAKACLVTSIDDSPLWFKDAVAMAKQSVDLTTKPTTWPWMFLCRGIAEYRTGENEAALASFEEIDDSAPRACKALAHSFRAMASYHAGDTIAATRWLNLAREVSRDPAETILSKNLQAWVNEVFAQYALREAEVFVDP